MDRLRRGLIKATPDHMKIIGPRASGKTVIVEALLEGGLLRAGLGLVESAHAIRQYLHAQYPGRELPRFEVNVALHSGPVTLTVLQDPLHGTAAQTLPVGDAVSATMLLQKQANDLGWAITASVNTLRSITGAVRIDRRALVELPGRSAPMDAAEVVGLAL